VRLLMTAINVRVVRALMEPHARMGSYSTHVIVQPPIMESTVIKFARTIIVMTTVRSSQATAIRT